MAMVVTSLQAQPSEQVEQLLVSPIQRLEVRTLGGVGWWW
jgi:hypothetical protein